MVEQGVGELAGLLAAGGGVLPCAGQGGQLHLAQAVLTGIRHEALGEGAGGDGGADHGCQRQGSAAAVLMGWHAGRAWFEPIIARLGGDGLSGRH